QVYSPAATCRTAATAKPSRPLGPAAWPRTKWRNTWRTKVTDGEVLKGCRRKSLPQGAQRTQRRSTEEIEENAVRFPLCTSVPPVVKLLIFTLPKLRRSS